jgi:FixJ family two-component response regulator
MKQGASDFLTKPVNDEDLLAAVRVAIEKNRALHREQAELSEIRARLATLTPREREVLEYVVAGKLNKQIAGELGTVELATAVRYDVASTSHRFIQSLLLAKSDRSIATDF